MKTKKYSKPTIIINDSSFEGVYASSGSQTAECKSIYILGNPITPTYNPIEDGYMLGRGCEGCPAWNAESCVCRLITNPQEMNWTDDFRPSWEVNGHLPDEKGY